MEVQGPHAHSHHQSWFRSQKTHMLEQCVRTLEENRNNAPSNKTHSESTSPTPPVRRPILPMEKLQEAKIQGIEALLTCLEQQIDA